MPALISKYPLDITGRSPTNLVGGEQHLLLERGATPYRVVSFNQGGFYTKHLKVYDNNFKLLKPNLDYVATYKHVDFSTYTGLEVCSAVVILNPDLQGFVVLGAQMVGGDAAFSLDVEEVTITYLNTLPVNERPVWAGLIGDYPQWQPGELQEERWERHHYGHLNASIERLGYAVSAGNGVAEEQERRNIKQGYETFLARFQGQVLTHINDLNRPHALTRADIGLPLVENFPLATQAIAREGVSLGHYLTPKTVWDVLDQHAYVPLQGHISHRNTAHSPTAAQLSTYTYAQFDAELAPKLGVTETAQAANGMQGYWSVIPDYPVDFTLPSMYMEMRMYLNAYNFTTGRVPPWVIGSGYAGSNSILLANGVWRDYQSVFNMFLGYTTTKMLYAGYMGTDSAAIAHISATYTDMNAYPSGTVVTFTVTNDETYIGYNNGGSGWTAYNSERAAIRSGYSWFVLY